jgi:hypothetical protein
MAADGYTTIQRTVTVAEGEMFAELFRREGIEALFSRTTGAQLGMGEQLFELRIEVPVEFEARARELLAELEYVGSTKDEGSLAGDDDADPAAPRVIARRPVLAAGIAFLVPGGAHFHARRPWTGLLVGTTLLCGWLTAFGFLTWRGSFGGEMLFGGLVALWLAESIGGARAAMAENRGEHPSRARQLARGFALIACASVAGAAFATAASAPRWLLARKLARFDVRCTPRSVVVANGDPDGRTLWLSDLTLQVSPSRWKPVRYRLEHGGSPTVEASPGATAAFNFVLPDDVIDQCRAGTCELLFALTASRRSDAATAALDGLGTCVPYWDQPDTSWPGRIDPAATAQ